MGPARQSKPPFHIRPLESDGELKRCEEIQEEVWRFAREDLVTSPMLRLSLRHGGLLLGAFHRSGRMVGFVYAFPSLWEGRLSWHSHMLAVLAPFRDLGIGFALKRAQYEAAARAGVSMITWTFDPLEAKNAHLNLNKLGVRVRRYYVNLYGEETSSVLHRGLGTDRFLAEWPVTPSGIPTPPLPAECRGPLVLETRPGPEPHRLPGALHLEREEEKVLVEVPCHIQELKGRDPRGAAAWREATRQVFLHYLARGYEIRRLLLEGKPRRAFYVLERS